MAATGTFTHRTPGGLPIYIIETGSGDPRTSTFAYRTPGGLPVYIVDAAAQTYTQALSDSLGSADTLANQIARLITETQSLAEVLARQTGKVTFAETQAFTETLARTVARSTVADTLVLVESLAQLVAIAPTDAQVVAELLVLATQPGSLADTQVVTETLTKTVTRGAVVETLSLADLLSEMAGHVASADETQTLAEALSLVTGQGLADVLPLAEVLAMAVATSPLAETETLAETLTRQAERAALAEAQAVLEAVTATVLHVTALADPQATDEVLGLLQMSARSIAEGVTVSEALGLGVRIGRVDLLTATEALTRQGQRAVADLQAVSEAQARLVGAIRAEVLSLAEQWGGILNRPVADTQALAETLRRLVARGLIEGTAPSEVLRGIVKLGRIAESVTAGEAFSRKVVKKLQEFQATAERLIAPRKLKVITEKDQKLAETLTRLKIAAVHATKALTDSMVAAETLTRQRIKRLTFAESQAATEIGTPLKVKINVVGDTLTLLEASLRRTTRLMAEAVGAADTLVKRPPPLAMTESLTLIDAFNALKVKVANGLADVLDSVELVTQRPGLRAIQEAQVSAESLGLASARYLTESAPVAEALSRYVTQSLADPEGSAESLAVLHASLLALADEVTLLDTAGELIGLSVGEDVQGLYEQSSQTVLQGLADVLDSVEALLGHSQTFAESQAVTEVLAILHKMLLVARPVVLSGGDDRALIAEATFPIVLSGGQDRAVVLAAAPIPSVTLQGGMDRPVVLVGSGT